MKTKKKAKESIQKYHTACEKFGKEREKFKAQEYTFNIAKREFEEAQQSFLEENNIKFTREGLVDLDNSGHTFEYENSLNEMVEYVFDKLHSQFGEEF